MGNINNLAEQTPSIENLVRRILNSVREVPGETHNSGEARETSVARSGPINDTSVEQEINRRFNIPRTEYSTQGSISMDGPPSTSTHRSYASSLSQQYNPGQNYGYTNYSGNRNSNPQRRRHLSPYTRSRSGSGSNVSSKSSSVSHGMTMAIKEVILLKHGNETEVPKYGRRSELHRSGYIVDAVEIEKNLSGKELRDNIQAIFADKLKSTGFDFVKCIGKTLNEINLPKGTELTAKVLLGVVKQGPIYMT